MANTKQRAPLVARLAEKGYISPRDAADKVGVTTNSIRQLMRSGKLDVIRVGHRLFVSQASLARHFGPKVSELLGLKA